MNRNTKMLKGAAAGLGTAALMAVMTATTAFGGTWYPENGQWRYQADGGQQAGAGWIQEGENFYAIDENGFMRSGWFQDINDNGRWYFLNPQQGGPQGAMQTGWLADNGRSCIVNGKAQCSGYADAFLQTAKACGLEVRYVHNTTKAKGVAYGPKVVAQYLKDNTIDTSKGKQFSQEMDEFFAKVRNEDGSNMITYTNLEGTAKTIQAYLDTQIEARKDSYGLVIRYPSSFRSDVTGDYSKLVDLNNQLEDLVNTYINTKYQDVLKNQFRFFLLLKADADCHYYTHETGTFRYQDGKGKKVDYMIHFMDVDGNEVGTQSGTGEKGKSVTLEFPSGYSWISNGKANYKVKEGNALYHGRTFSIKGAEAVDMEVRVRTADRKKSAKASASEAEELLD